jgi:hypothetical protein
MHYINHVKELIDGRLRKEVGMAFFVKARVTYCARRALNFRSLISVLKILCHGKPSHVSKMVHSVEPFICVFNKYNPDAREKWAQPFLISRSSSDIIKRYH